VWVEVNRDRTPEIPERFQVSSYPSLLVLGYERENVHRFSGFKKPPEFLVELEQGLRRFASYRRGEEWDKKEPRAPAILDGMKVTTLPAQSEELPSGIARAGEVLWVAQRRRLSALDPATGAVQRSRELPAAVNGLCCDGARLYAVEYGWSKGDPIHVLDSRTGESLGQITTEANRTHKGSSTFGIAAHGGLLHVLSGGDIVTIDKKDGAEQRRIRTAHRYCVGLMVDGDDFVVADREALHWIDARTGKDLRSVPTHYPVRALACDEQGWWLMEQPVAGFDRRHRPVRLWPEKTMIHRVARPASQ
jgi:hypothetical protein